MAVVDGIVQTLRRSRQVGQSAVFVSTDGSGTELRLPTEFDRHFHEPAEVTILVSLDDFEDVEIVEEGADADEPDTDADLARAGVGVEEGVQEYEDGASEGVSEDVQEGDGAEADTEEE